MALIVILTLKFDDTINLKTFEKYLCLKKPPLAILKSDIFTPRSLSVMFLTSTLEIMLQLYKEYCSVLKRNGETMNFVRVFELVFIFSSFQTETQLPPLLLLALINMDMCMSGVGKVCGWCEMRVLNCFLWLSKLYMNSFFFLIYEFLNPQTVILCIHNIIQHSFSWDEAPGGQRD